MRLSLVLLVFLLGIGQLFAQPPAFPQLAPGIDYLQERSGDQPWAIFVVKVRRDRPEYQVVSTLAQGTIFGLATVPEQVKALPPALGTPLVALNGDWFDLPAGPYQGDLINLFIHQGQLVSLPGWGETCWFDAQGAPHLDHVVTDLQATWPDGMKTALGLNGPRTDDAAVLYTPILGPSTHTTGGRELVLERVAGSPWLPLTIGQQLRARVREVREAGDTPLAPETMVLSLGPRVKAPAVPQGAEIQLSVTSTPDLSGASLAIGGGPIVLKDGNPPNRPAAEHRPSEAVRHPRTLVGWNDTHLFLIVVDGRRPGWSAGMTIPELSALVQRLGCTNALNLDGGGSSTLWLNDQVINLPSDGKPRSVGNALVVVKR